MCLAVPGKIISIENDIATVDYEVEERTGHIIEGEYSIGDYVIIQGGFLIQKVPSEEAIRALELYVKAVGE